MRERLAPATLAAWCRFALGGEGAALPAPPADAREAAVTARVLIANRLAPAVGRALGARTAVSDLDAAGWDIHAWNALAHPVRDEARRAAEHALASLAGLREVADVLDAAGVRWLLWKGPALAMQVWGDPTRRDFTDLDVVVLPADLAAARAALDRAGWRARDAMPPRTERAIHAGSGAYPLERADRPLLELHWTFSGTNYPTVATVADVLARAEPLTIAGRTVLTPGGADALLLLAMHATKHGWSQAEEVLSFARLSSRDPAALGEASVRAAIAGVPRVMALAVELAERLASVGATGGQSRGAHTMDAGGETGTMVDACLERMCAGDGAWRQTHAWTRSWISRPSDRLRYYASALFSPTPQEWKWIRLPEPLVWMYPLVRVARLALRRVSGVRR